MVKNNYHENFIKLDVRHDRRRSIIANKIRREPTIKESKKMGLNNLKTFNKKP